MLYLSIIIPTINRYFDLRNTIKFLQKQSFQEYEIIIIDQTDKEKAEDISSLDGRIQYHWSPIKSASHARNIGIKTAKGAILLFLDDDVIISNEDFLKKHLICYDNNSVPGVAGAVLEGEQKLRTTRHWLSEKKQIGWLFFPQNYAYSTWIDTGRSCNLSVRRDLALSIGGMDENFQKGAHREEADFCWRISQKYGLFYYEPSTVLFHIGNPNGGIRSWNDKSFVKAQHHFDGAMYFIFKNIPLKYYPHHLFAILFFFFYDKKLFKNPYYFFLTFLRFIKGCFNAVRFLKEKPKYLNFE